jgi:hypothetical protein
VSKSKPVEPPKGRLDHLLPRGYLDGFTDPSTPGQIAVLDIRNQRWFESGAPRVAAIRGFYDYSAGSEPDKTADEAFKEFEEKFPIIVRELIGKAFSGWRDHLEFLLGYGQMLRARTELFREQELAQARQATMLRVKEIFQDPKTGQTAIRYEPMTETGAEREGLFRNLSITKMRGEIAKGAALFSKMNWCLRITNASADPVITGDTPVIVEGQAPTLEAALEDPRTLLFFPLCWRACLVGSPTKFDVETDSFDACDLRRLRFRYLRTESRFAYSPTRIAE